MGDEQTNTLLRKQKNTQNLNEKSRILKRNRFCSYHKIGDNIGYIFNDLGSNMRDNFPTQWWKKFIQSQ